MVEREVLKNKPLVEAIFEVRWRLKEKQAGVVVDEDFPLVPGLLYGRLRDRYPESVTLPFAELPPEIGGQVPRFQFRSKGGVWPLVQVGPGIVTLNDTDHYVWEDFIKRIEHLVGQLFVVYETIGHQPEIERLTIRYIDAIWFDYRSEDVFTFLQEKLKIQLGIIPAVFADTTVSPTPAQLALDLSYGSTDPPGAITISFTTGQRLDSNQTPMPALIWNTVFTSEPQVSVRTKDDILQWVEGGHALINHWFFTLIDGDLREQFRG